MISVLIATKNRHKNINSVLVSLLVSTFKNFEIIVIDQSINSKTMEKIISLNSKKIRYLHLDSTGKSKALNHAIEIANGDIFAFTDDDCIVSPTWLEEINRVFKKEEKISAVFGDTLPHNPAEHKNKVCPSTFVKRYSYIIKSLKPHFNHIGFGNNMAIRKVVFDKTLKLKTWLGPGSVGSNAEDAEITFRILVNNFKIYHDSKLIVNHNRWLDQNELRKANLSYTCGEMACYGYYASQGFIFARPIVLNNIKDSYYKFRKILKKIILLKWENGLMLEIKYSLIEIIYRTRGLLVALFYSIFDPVAKAS